MWLEAKTFPPRVPVGNVSAPDGLDSVAPSAALLSRCLPPGSESGELVVEEVRRRIVAGQP
jgi:hypothetical protein